MDSREYKYAATLLRVVDGDTIDLDVDLGFNIHQKMRIRLMDIDTPEIRGEEKVKGLKVKDLVEELCKDAESIVLESIKGKKENMVGTWDHTFETRRRGMDRLK